MLTRTRGRGILTLTGDQGDTNSDRGRGGQVSSLTEHQSVGFILKSFICNLGFFAGRRNESVSILVLVLMIMPHK